METRMVLRMTESEIEAVARDIVVEFLDSGVEFMDVVEYDYDGYDEIPSDDTFQAIHNKTRAILNELAGNL